MADERCIVFRPLAPETFPGIRLRPGESKTVGRSEHADLTIAHASVSRLHARIVAGTDGTVTVEDLGSTNGVAIDGERGMVGPAGVRVGQRVDFGSVEYVVSAEADGASDRPDWTILRAALPNDVRGIDRVLLESLVAASRELMAFGDLPGLLDRVLDRLQPILTPDRSAILLIDPETAALRPRSVRPAGAYRSVSEFASATVVSEALAAREVLVVSDALQDQRLQHAESIMRANVRSVLCVPLMGRTGAVGALYADRRGVTRHFTPQQVEYAAAFAAHAAAAIETARLYDDREQHFRATLEAFAKAIDARDRYTAGHSERVTAYALVLAGAAGLPSDQFETLRRAGMLHDIGKVGVRDDILLKSSPLDSTERVAMERHVTIGHEMLASVPFLQASLPGIRGHHEGWDGNGYPDRLVGRAIHVHARLLSVADAYDAMTTDRPYRRGLSVGEAARRLREAKGSQFDPAAIELFDAAEDEFSRIQGESGRTS